MWNHLIGESSRTVGKQGRLSRPDGANLRIRPIDGAPIVANVPFNSLLQVQRITSHGWAWIVVLEGPAAGQAGFIVANRIAMDPPEPTAQLHWVTSGERLGTIAERYYGAALNKQNNERLFVQALYEANKERAGVYLEPINLSMRDTVHRSDAAEESLRVFKGLKVKRDHALWIPDVAFVYALKQAGAISDGRSSISHAWDTASGLVSEIADAATLGAGLAVGILEGAWKAVIDLFKGAADMVEAVGTTLLHAFTGNFTAIKKMATDLVDKLSMAWQHRGAIADAFLSKWNAESAWDRGNFRGEVVGWVMATVLIIFITAGEGAIATALGSSTWGARFLSAVRTADALGDIGTYARGISRTIKLPEKVSSSIRKEMRVTESLVEGADESASGLSKPPEVASGVAEPPDPLLRGGQLDSRQLDFDRRLEEAMEGMIEIGKREITPTDLAALTKKTSLEHAVVILKNDKRMLVRLGSYKGGQLPENTKRLLIHSHPDDFGSGMAKFISPQDVEAVVALGQKYSYMVTIDGTVYRFTAKTIPYTTGEVVRQFHPFHGWIGK